MAPAPPRTACGVIVTAHQPTYLPGVSVMAKVAQADAVVWLDGVRFTTPGYVNRNQLPDGTWLTVPVDRIDHRSTIAQVTIAGTEWKAEHIAAVRDYYADAGYERLVPFAETIGERLEGGRLVDLNLDLVGWMLRGFGLAPKQFRQTDYPAPSGSLSSKLVRMVKEVGGTTYLSGPSSRLDRDVFEAAGVKLAFFDFAGDNPSAIDPLLRHGELPSGAGAPRQQVRAA
jgi:hypothetical protein